MLCHRCQQEFADSRAKTWENACPRCGALAWLRCKEVVQVVVESPRAFTGGYGFECVLGDGVAAFVQSKSPLVAGQTVSAVVLQVDHEQRWVGLEARG